MDCLNIILCFDVLFCKDEMNLKAEEAAEGLLQLETTCEETYEQNTVLYCLYLDMNISASL